MHPSKSRRLDRPGLLGRLDLLGPLEMSAHLASPARWDRLEAPAPLAQLVRLADLVVPAFPGRPAGLGSPVRPVGLVHPVCLEPLVLQGR
ncbi:hypothetical protein C1Y40_03125 [Mycobacterium talmoniae]|uniref:Uncharacterized protein n=1 Tax=Mycobacterium talmoniae TaxID=1858794 RepID=A0A2S8BJA0_9MYCO|nr:hypothetical protein C1Y40_03125 [Mycobacterium talmoniae]